MRARSGRSKAQVIREFLEVNRDRAFYSTEIAEVLRSEGVEQRDVMGSVRRAEKKGLVYVRGYRTHDRQTPFREGYIVTWVDPDKPREQVLEEAVYRTDEALKGKASTNPIIERGHMIRDVVIEGTKLRDLVSFNFIQNKLGCTGYEAENAVGRAMQIYPDIHEVKVFNNFRYYHHASMQVEDLNAARATKSLKKEP